jgi:hypothetical protein
MIAQLIPLLLLLMPVQGREADDARLSFILNVEIEKGEIVQEVVCVFCSVDVRGVVTGDAVAAFGNLRISGEVRGDAVAAGGYLDLVPGAKHGEEVIAVGGEVYGEAETDGVELVSVPYLFLPGQRHVFYLGAFLFFAAFVLICTFGARLVRSTLLDSMVTNAVSHKRPLLVSAVLMLFIPCLVEVMLPGQSAVFEWFRLVLEVLHVILFIIGLFGVTFAVGTLVLRGWGFWGQALGGAIVSGLVLLIPLLGIVAVVVLYLAAIGLAGLEVLRLIRRVRGIPKKMEADS